MYSTQGKYRRTAISSILNARNQEKNKKNINRDFPFTLHRNSPSHLKSPNIKISLRLQQFSGRPSELSRKNAKRVEHLRREAAFSYYFCTPPPLPSIPEPGFQQYHTSSRPRRYWQKTQLPDSVKYFPKERLRHCHFRDLKYHVTGIVDHFGSYLDELISECPQRPLLH